MSRSAVSPRVFQLYSPRRPSPLGLPPFGGSHIQDLPCNNSAYPKTPERYYYQHSEPTSHGVRFPPDVHRRGNSTTQRAQRASPPAPLSLDTLHHPAAAMFFHHLPSIEETLQPHAASQEMKSPSPSPTSSSSTSSLSLYSAESAKKKIGEEGEGEGGETKKIGGGGGFCLCINFSALFGTTKQPNKILAPPPQVQQVLAAEPAPAPQMVQTRRRPPSLVLVR